MANRMIPMDWCYNMVAARKINLPKPVISGIYMQRKNF